MVFQGNLIVIIFLCIYYYLIKFIIYILITLDQVMLVQPAAHIFVLVALKLFLIRYCIIF